MTTTPTEPQEATMPTTPTDDQLLIIMDDWRAKRVTPAVAVQRIRAAFATPTDAEGIPLATPVLTRRGFVDGRGTTVLATHAGDADVEVTVDYDEAGWPRVTLTGEAHARVSVRVGSRTFATLRALPASADDELAGVKFYDEGEESPVEDSDEPFTYRSETTETVVERIPSGGTRTTSATRTTTTVTTVVER